MDRVAILAHYKRSEFVADGLLGLRSLHFRMAPE